MDRPLNLWARLLLRLGLVLLAVGVLPALAVQYVLVDVDALIPALLLFSVAPLGALILLLAAILFLAALVRHWRSAPSSAARAPSPPAPPPQ